jgi:AcrR family transcriptional regulator
MPPVSKSVSASQAPLTASSGVRSGASSEVDSGDRSGPLRSSGLVTDPVDGRVARALRLRQERSTQLLAVARRLFAKRRYHQTSIQDILDEAGVARGTLYLHFDGKRAMFDALVDSFLTSIRSVVTLVDVSPDAPPPLQQIEENLLRVMAVLSENRDMTSIVLLMVEGIDSEADSKMADFYDRLRGLLQGALVKGCAMGLFGPIDPEIVAQAALGGLKEVALQWIVRRDSDEATLRRVCREILSYSLSGMLARE